MLTELIARVPLFGSLSPSEIAALAGGLRQRECPAGEVLFREGEAGEAFYVLLEGRVEIIKALGGEGERLLGVREPGGLIGEMSLFQQQGRRTASVRMRTPARLLEVTRGDFEALLARHPAMAFDLVRVLSQRLDAAETLTVRDLVEKNRELTRAYEELKAAQAQLIEKEKLEAELAVARRIQRSILPRERPILAGYDFGMLMEPMTSVGGDFFDFIPLGEGRLGIVVGDVSGHGAPAAIFMALTYSLLRAEAGRCATPGEALRSVNRHLLGMNESAMFVTMLYGILEAGTREFRFARAGHDLPLVLDADGGALELALGDGQLLGVLPAPDLDEQTVLLPPGGLLVMFTDGVTEAVDVSRQQFGVDGILGWLRSGAAAGCGAQVACDGVRDAVRGHAASPIQQDDITLVAVRVG